MNRVNKPLIYYIKYKSYNFCTQQLDEHPADKVNKIKLEIMLKNFLRITKVSV